ENRGKTKERGVGDVWRVKGVDCVNELERPSQNPRVVVDGLRVMGFYPSPRLSPVRFHSDAGANEIAVAEDVVDTAH
ncbi:MAG: hypothetical protein RIS76_4723, partial [Verrucomicrobiota bacterium]